MSNEAVVANITRALLDHLTTWAATLVPPVAVKNSDIRDPLKEATEDECFQFRFGLVRRQITPRGQGNYILGYEIHAWSKRAELRNDRATDRHTALASLAQEHFQELDLAVYDAVAGHRGTVIGCFQTLDTTLHFRDKRNTIFGTSVDYSIETPTTLQAAVEISGVLNRGA